MTQTNNDLTRTVYNLAKQDVLAECSRELRYGCQVITGGPVRILEVYADSEDADLFANQVIDILETEQETHSILSISVVGVLIKDEVFSTYSHSMAGDEVFTYYTPEDMKAAIEFLYSFRAEGSPIHRVKVYAYLLDDEVELREEGNNIEQVFADDEGTLTQRIPKESMLR